ncbi:MAG: hypothetical protein ACR2NM_02525, partial [Bythopirellula sp.]
MFGNLCARPDSSAWGQPERDATLHKEPLAKVDVQALYEPDDQQYDNTNPTVMYRPEEEDPLSFYSRTQDGEWRIPPEVDADDPWVRLLMLGPGKPTIIDVAVELNQKPYRAAREGWIDRLLAEAKATFLVRTGAATAEAADSADAADQPEDEPEADEPEADEPVASEPEADEKESSAEGTTEAVAASEESADDTNADTSESDTSESDTPEDEASESEAPETKASESEAAVPMVKVQRRQASTLFKRLINYLAADQSTAEREEVRWLLAEWTGGPALLTLSPAFAWKRAADTPLWNALDRDGDQTLSSAEIAQSTTTLQESDINRNDIVSLSELRRLGKSHTAHDRTKGHPLIVVIDDQTDWNALKKYLRLAYLADNSAAPGSSLLGRLGRGDRTVTAADLTRLVALPADIVARISFADEAAQIALLAVGDSSSDRWRLHSSTADVITVEQQATYMELSAAQGEVDAENSSGDMQQTQVAIGGVVDGFPFLRLLDHDNNQQLTRRERIELPGFLRSFDRNQDGQIDAGEIPTAIRLAVTHGPNVHHFLSKPVNAQRDLGDQTEAE